jgi:plastocyanin
MRQALWQGAVVAIVGALSLWNCGGSSGYGGTTATNPATPSPAPPAGSVAVSIVGSSGNQAFKPNPVPVAAGEAVVFTNGDTVTHHIVLDDGSADLGNLAPGVTSRSVPISSSNAVNFHCTIHPSMVGSINGSAAPQPPPCNDPQGYSC